MATCPSCRGSNDDRAEVCGTCQRALCLPTGLILAERYEILAHLGRGGMGSVYKAIDHTLEERVAIKTLRADVGESPDMSRRFRAEIRLARKIGHRNICRIYEYGEDKALRFIAMELIEGVDLRHVIMQQGPFGAEEGVEIALQVAAGLEAIHEVGVIHRDLKSANLMRDGRGVVRLMDFGIAKQWGEDATHHTATGTVLGTPEYMSPEQARGMPIDFRSDIYAFGVVIYEFFTGNVPFRGTTPFATVLMHIQEPPPLDGPIAKKIPPPIIPILRKALAKSPDDRYPDMRAMAAALQAAQAQIAEGRSVRPGAERRPEANPRVASVSPGPSADSTHITPTPSPSAGGLSPEGFQDSGASHPRESSLPRMPSVAEGFRAAAQRPWLLASGALVVLGALGVGVIALLFMVFGPDRSTPSTQDPTPSAQVVPGPTPSASPTLVPAPPETTAITTVATPAASCALRVTSTPSAQVSLDGKPLGSTPLTATVEAGTHTLRFIHPKYRPYSRKISIQTERNMSVSVDLAEDAFPLPGR